MNACSVTVHNSISAAVSELYLFLVMCSKYFLMLLQSRCLVAFLLFSSCRKSTVLFTEVSGSLVAVFIQNELSLKCVFGAFGQHRVFFLNRYLLQEQPL